MLCTSLQLFCFVADKTTGRKTLTNDRKLSCFILRLNLRLRNTEQTERLTKIKRWNAVMAWSHMHVLPCVLYDSFNSTENSVLQFTLEERLTGFELISTAMAARHFVSHKACNHKSQVFNFNFLVLTLLPASTYHVFQLCALASGCMNISSLWNMFPWMTFVL